MVLAVALPVAALRADTSGFKKIVDWSTILACSIGALGVFFVVLDRRRVPEAPSMQALDDAADRLAARVLDEEGKQRARLLGTDAASLNAANVGFDRVDRVVEFEDASTGHHGDLDTVTDFYQQHSSRRLVILGTPGSGKTVLALELLVKLLERRRDRTGDIGIESKRVPIRLSLPTWNTDQSLQDWLISELITRYRLAEQIVRGLIGSGYILPVLDGLDEMDNEEGVRTRAIAAVSQLNEYIVGTSGGPLVVTCRSADYAQITTSITPVTEVNIRPLTADQIIHYLRREVRDRDGKVAWLAWHVLLDKLSDPHDRRVLEQLQTPWRLTLAVTFYRGGGSLADLLPAPFERAITAETTKQYADRVSVILVRAFIPARIRLHSSHCTPEQATKWLRSTAIYLGHRADRGLSGSDIVLDQCWPIAGDDNVRRWHGIAAAVMTVFSILALSVGVNGGVGNSAGNVAYFFANFPNLPRGFLIPGVSLAVFCILIPYGFALRARESVPEPRLVNIQKLRSHQGRRSFVVGFVPVFVAGVTIGLILGVLGAYIEGSLIGGFAGGLKFGVSFGLVLGLMLGFILGLEPSGDASVTDPLGPLRSDFATGFAIGCSLALGAWYARETVAEFTISFIAGLPFVFLGGAAVGLAYYSLAGLRYLIGVSLAACQRLLPVRFARFLHWAYEAGILRISGNAYQFRHTELRDWLRGSSNNGYVGPAPKVVNLDPGKGP